MNINLPKEIIDYLNSGGKTEGFLTIDPGYFQLWLEKDITQKNMEYQVKIYAPDFIGFGSNGAGGMLAFDKLGRIFSLPFIGMSNEEAILIADSWKEFEETIEA